MNYGSLRFYLKLRYLKAADDGGAGGGTGGTPAPGSDAGTSSPGGDVGGGSSVATPASDGGGVTPPSPSPDSDPWANLGSSEDLDYVEIPAAPPAPPPVSPTPTAPQPTPAQAAPTPPQPQPVAPQTPPVNPQGQTAPAQAPTAPPAMDLSPSDPAGMAVAMEQNRPALIQHLAQERFMLTPEEVQELETDAASAVPKLLAKVHLESHIAMQKFLAQAVPGMVQRHMNVSRANNEAEDKFFSTHKQLGLDKNNAQHRQTAVRTAKLYRQMYPDASLDQLISDIGPMVARAVGINAVPQTPAQVPPQPPTIMAPAQMPFRPAVNGGGPAPVPSNAPTDGNEWAGLGRDFD